VLFRSPERASRSFGPDGCIPYFATVNPERSLTHRTGHGHVRPYAVRVRRQRPEDARPDSLAYAVSVVVDELRCCASMSPPAADEISSGGVD